MSKKSLRLQMAKLLLKFATVETKEGNVLYLEGELTEGAEVFVEEADGTMVAAPEGEYHVDNKTIRIKEGKVESITEEFEETINPTEDNGQPKSDYDEAIMMLTNEVEVLKTAIEEIKADIEAIKNAAMAATAEEAFSKQEEAHKPIWQKF